MDLAVVGVQVVDLEQGHGQSFSRRAVRCGRPGRGCRWLRADAPSSCGGLVVRGRCPGAYSPNVCLGGGLAQIGLDDALVGLDLGGRALGDPLAVVEHGDALADAHDDAHLVLDEQDGDAQVVAEPSDETGHLVGLGRVHAGGRLVEQQEAWAGAQGPGDLQATLVAVGHVAGEHVVCALEPHVFEQTARLLERLLLLRSLRTRAQDRLEPGGLEVLVLAHEHVLGRGHAAEEADVLVGSRQAQPGDLVRAQLVDLGAVEGDAALVDLVEAGDAVEERGLARAIGSDDADDRALFEVEGQVADGGQAAEAFRRVAGLEQCHGLGSPARAG